MSPERSVKGVSDRSESGINWFYCFLAQWLAQLNRGSASKIDQKNLCAFSMGQNLTPAGFEPFHNKDRVLCSSGAVVDCGFCFGDECGTLSSRSHSLSTWKKPAKFAVISLASSRVSSRLEYGCQNSMV
jgi:hypothetical protein